MDEKKWIDRILSERLDSDETPAPMTQADWDLIRSAHAERQAKRCAAEMLETAGQIRQGLRDYEAGKGVEADAFFRDLAASLDEPPEPSPAAGFSIAERSSLARGLTSLFDKWGLLNTERCLLLGLSADDQASLDRYRAGAPLDDTPDMLARTAELLAIHHNLVRLYPENETLVFGWVKTPDTQLNGQPINLMTNEGLAGIRRIRQLLGEMVVR